MFGRNKRDQRERVEPTLNIADGAVVSTGESAEKLMEFFASFPSTSSGAVVNEHTAMQVSAVYACVSRIAGAIATLPIAVYERGDDYSRREVFGHDLWWLLNEEPCPSFGAASFWEFVVSQMLLRGDAIAYLYRGPNRFAAGVQAIIPIPRSRVAIQYEKVPKGYRGPRKLLYTISLDDGYFTCDQGDVLHFSNMGFDGLTAPSSIQQGARNAIGTAIQADDFAGKFFAQGAQPQHAIKAPGQMSPPQQEAFRAAWAAKYMGNGPSGIPLILTEGLDITELSMTAADAQLLESRKWQVADIARAFGVPAFMIGETEKTTSFGSGIEQMGRWFTQMTLKPHLKRFEDELNRKLWPRGQKYFVEYDVTDWMRGDMAAEAEYYARAIGGNGNQGWITPNEARRRMNLPPLPGGDELVKLAPPPTSDEAKGNESENEPAKSDAGEQSRDSA